MLTRQERPLAPSLRTGQPPVVTLREMLAQEGQVMARAGCAGPVLDEEDIAYTRAVLTPFLDAADTTFKAS